MVATGIGIDWVAGDEVHGRSSTLRATCTEPNLTSVFIVPINFQFTTPAGTTMTAAQAGTLADTQDAFERRPCGDGSKGPRLFCWALVATTDPHEFLPGPATILLGYSPVPTHPDQPRPADLGQIKLSVAEHHRLLQLARAKAAGLLSRAAEIFHLHWSSLRRRHQAIARWHHYRRRLHQALDPG